MIQVDVKVDKSGTKKSWREDELRKFLQDEIDSLINCQKEITEPPKRQMIEVMKHKRNEMDLKSKDGKHSFHVYFRQSVEFPEDFSVGLVYFIPEERESLTLFRCNGIHDVRDESQPHPAHHYVFHIHRAKQENIARESKPERGGETTGFYATFEQAISHFLHEINVINYQDCEFFNDIDQGFLPFMEVN